MVHRSVWTAWRRLSAPGHLLVRATPCVCPLLQGDENRRDVCDSEAVGRSTLCVRDCHLLCMTSILVYEEPAIITQVTNRSAISTSTSLIVFFCWPSAILAGCVCGQLQMVRSSLRDQGKPLDKGALFTAVLCVSLLRWGLQLHRVHIASSTPCEAQSYAPDIAWSVASSDSAVIVAFRGANPFTQVPTALRCLLHCKFKVSRIMHSVWLMLSRGTPPLSVLPSKVPLEHSAICHLTLPRHAMCGPA